MKDANNQSAQRAGDKIHQQDTHDGNNNAPVSWCEQPGILVVTNNTSEPIMAVSGECPFAD